MAPLQRRGSPQAAGGDHETGNSPEFVARILAWMYVAAGLLCFAVYVLPVPPETYKPGFAAIGCATFVCAAS